MVYNISLNREEFETLKLCLCIREDQLIRVLRSVPENARLQKHLESVSDLFTKFCSVDYAVTD